MAVFLRYSNSNLSSFQGDSWYVYTMKHDWNNQAVDPREKGQQRCKMKQREDILRVTE